MAIERIVVVGGGGLMGNGICQVVAGAGFQVTMVDLDETALDRGRGRIRASLERLAKAGTIAEADVEATLGRIAASTSLEDAAADADHVIETVVEDPALKADVLRRLDAACRDDVILASNTSQISISRLAAATSRPDRVVGSHWFNPPPIMRLIELVRGVETSDETLATATELAQRYGKETVVCKRDTQGFITSRLACLFALEAARIVEEGIANADDVNRACRLAFGHAMGPLDTADLSGLDTLLRVSEGMTDCFGERFRAPQNIRALVAAGHFGRKTGRGFGEYGEAR